MRAILLNGPPRSGKDTIGEMLVKHLPVPSIDLMKFADPIRWFLRETFGVDIERDGKDQPHPKLHGKTPRQAAIQYSEGFCKPLFGVGYFGEVAKRMLRRDVTVFTDSGFRHEAEVLPVPCLQVLIYRNGHNFVGDSRSYWHSDRIGHIEFANDAKNLQELEDKVRADLVPEIMQWMQTS